jgi:hypothetical protein
MKLFKFKGMAVVTHHLGRKLAVVAISGGTALGLFGGAAVHTQFSASTSLHADASGALVALTVNGGTDGHGNLTCTNLLPGGAVCSSGQISLNNTGTVPEDFTVTLGQISVNNGGVHGDVLSNLDQAQIWMGFGAGAVLGTGSHGEGPVPLTNYFTNGTGAPIAPGSYLIGTALGAGQQNHGSMTLSLEPGSALVSPDDANAWNGASITIPYTITATAGV